MEFFNIIAEVFRESVLITGLVIVIMMVIESLNISSRGRIFNKLGQTSFGQIILAAFLGVIPGCMGGFATVSLYTHRLVSFGALTATMVATAGDEAFFMLAMFPKQASKLFLILFILAIVVGYITDRIAKFRHSKGLAPAWKDIRDNHALPIHDDHIEHVESGQTHEKKRHFGWKRLTMLAGTGLFAFAIAAHIYHELIAAETEAVSVVGLPLLNETWIHLLFVVIAISVLFVLLLWPDHFVDEHLWNHIIRKHLLKIFGWTFSVLAIMALLAQFTDITTWLSENMFWMFVLAVLLGLIPQSGPNMVFISLFATGSIPFAILLANSIVQEGHAALPLIAESKRSFVIVKLIKIITASLVCLPFLI